MPELRSRFAPHLLPHLFPHGNACVVRVHRVLKGSLENLVCEKFLSQYQEDNAKIRCSLVLLRSDGLLREVADAMSASLAGLQAALLEIHAPRMPSLTFSALRYQFASGLRAVISI